MACIFALQGISVLLARFVFRARIMYSIAERTRNHTESGRFVFRLNYGCCRRKSKTWAYGGQRIVVHRQKCLQSLESFILVYAATKSIGPIFLKPKKCFLEFCVFALVCLAISETHSQKSQVFRWTCSVLWNPSLVFLRVWNLSVAVFSVSNP